MRFIEFDVDFEECGEVEEVILHDMYGRHESIVLKRGAEYRKPTTLSQLEDENTRLRELVEDMLSCIEIRSAFGRPPTDEMYETFARRARELGVEVGT